MRPGPIQGDMVHPYLRRRSGQGGGRLPVRRTAPGARQDPGRAAVPGTGDADRDRRRRVSPRRGRPAAPRDGDLQAQRRDPPVPRQIHRRHGRRTATSAISPSAASTRSRGSAPTAFPKAMPRALRCSSMSRPGSNASTPRFSPARCSTASRWGSTRRRRSSATRASTASRCCRSMSTTATGTARWSRTLPICAPSRRPLRSLLRMTMLDGIRQPVILRSARAASRRTHEHRGRAYALALRLGFAPDQGILRGRCRASRRGARRAVIRDARGVVARAAGSAAPRSNASPRPMRCARWINQGASTAATGCGR